MLANARALIAKQLAAMPFSVRLNDRIAALASASLIALAAPQAQALEINLGNAVGAVAGGIVGNNIVKGTGKAIMTGVGAIGGAILGGKIHEKIKAGAPSSEPSPWEEEVWWNNDTSTGSPTVQTASEKRSVMQVEHPHRNAYSSPSVYVDAQMEANAAAHKLVPSGSRALSEHKPAERAIRTSTDTLIGAYAHLRDRLTEYQSVRERYDHEYKWLTNREEQRQLIRAVARAADGVESAATGYTNAKDEWIRLRNMAAKDGFDVLPYDAKASNALALAEIDIEALKAVKHDRNMDKSYQNRTRPRF